MIFLGVDWAEAHHDLCLLSETGTVLARGRIPDGVEGVARLHEMVAEHASDPTDVVVGIELDRGLLVTTLVASGYELYAINPLSVDRYRDRHRVSGAKSDPGDAKVLAEIVRIDRHNHRPIAGDSGEAEAIKVLARAHKDLIWSKQRQINRLRSLLREFYPAALTCFGSDLGSVDALAVLDRAPSPEQGRRLTRSQIVAALRRGGRRRNLEPRAEEIAKGLRSSQLEAPEVLASAYGVSVKALVAVLREIAAQIDELERELGRSFRSHPDAEIWGPGPRRVRRRPDPLRES